MKINSKQKNQKMEIFQINVKIVKKGVNKMDKKQIEQENINQAIGELLCREKYKFIQDGLLGEIIRDFIEIYNR